MPRGIWNSIKSVAVIAALVVSADSFDVRANTAYANECLAAPNASSPQGQHWYYRIERPNHRKCWYLRAPLPSLHRLVTKREHQRHAMSIAANPPMPGFIEDGTSRSAHMTTLAARPQLVPFIIRWPKNQVSRAHRKLVTCLQFREKPARSRSDPMDTPINPTMRWELP